jgi:chromosome segregation ATPase
MTDHNPRRHQVGDDGEVSFSDQLAEFVSTVSSALDSADGVDDDDVEAVERAGEELVERAEEGLEEDTASARVDELEDDVEELERSIEHTSNNASGAHERISNVEDELEAVDNDASPNGQTPETGLEQLARLPDELLEDESANVRRCVTVAEVWREHASKAEAGYVLSSGQLARVLRDETECRGHSQTASRVIERLDQLGGDGVSVVERRGERRVAFDADLVGRLEAMSEQPSPAAEGNAGHGVVSEEVAQP